jgi:large subunit ribosomal protein L6
MSRIGNAPVQIPSGIEVEKASGEIIVKGPKGTLNMNIDPAITMEITDNVATFSRKNDLKKNKSLHGLMRALFANMVNGVQNGWTKKLELVGVGFRAVVQGDKLVLTIGFSHPVEIVAPEGIQFEVTDNTKITVSGIDKNLVGQVAANIRAIKRPEPYKGKGIRYEGEYIKRKAGKAGKVGAGAK